MLRNISILTVMTLCVTSSMNAGERQLTLDECRQMALQNNKQMQIGAEKVKAAGYQKKEAFAAYLPAIDFNGGYVYNQKNLSLFDSDQLLPIKTFDLKTQSYQFSVVKNPLTGEPVKGPNGQPIPEQVAYLPKDAMTFDIHNVFFGAVTLTQPVFMGGKIVAMNKLTGYAEELAREMHSAGAQDVIYAVDAAYWQVVSLEAKHRLATEFVALMDSLDSDVRAMVRQGVATRSDQLSVDVKLNQAQIDLTKVKNGLSLSKMALAQICGLPISDEYTVAEDLSRVIPDAEIASTYNMEDVYARRHDIRALELGGKITGQQKNVALSSMLPNVALVGAYSFSSPNVFNGFKNRVNGGFSVGVGVNIPIVHWGGNYNKYRAARSQQTVMELQLDEAKEKVELQVTQAAYKAQEALKTYDMTLTNMAKADENLRTAKVGFREAVLTADDVMKAQTAWLQANSEKIDAAIEVHLCDVYLSKVLGTLDPATDNDK
ncbi:MAG: TolC family protein [Muribaculaceae bacterium]|nr:TolC family protein [Muribaculaceae bacterium]MDE6462369.1 TolC family protein [Muribaculaceae bacterium]